MLRYGLEDEAQTYKKVGRALGFSKETARTYENEALTRLRKILER